MHRPRIRRRGGVWALCGRPCVDRSCAQDSGIVTVWVPLVLPLTCTDATAAPEWLVALARVPTHPGVDGLCRLPRSLVGRRGPPVPNVRAPTGRVGTGDGRVRAGTIKRTQRDPAEQSRRVRRLPHATANGGRGLALMTALPKACSGFRHRRRRYCAPGESSATDRMNPITHPAARRAATPQPAPAAGVTPRTGRADALPRHNAPWHS
jgi:hypothetical protein